MEEHLVEKFENDTHKLCIYQDDIRPDPRENGEFLGTMVYSHRDYILGDVKAENIDCYSSWDEWFAHELGDDVIALPLYMYDHSGITIRTHPFNCPWDSGQVGYIYVTKEDVRKEWNVKRISSKLKKKIIDILEAEIEVYDQWGRGDVYGFVLSKKCSCNECNHEHDDVIDSCWGFYGTDWEYNGMTDHLDDIGIELLKSEPVEV